MGKDSNVGGEIQFRGGWYGTKSNNVWYRSGHRYDKGNSGKVWVVIIWYMQ